MRTFATILLISALAALGCPGAGIDGPDDPIKLHPVRIVVLVDKTGSVKQNGIDQPVPEDLVTLVELVGVAGGELAVGRITDSSDKPLWRFAVETPPVEPIRPAQDGNPFQVDVEMAEYAQVMAGYREKLQSWTDGYASKEESFMQSMRSFLEGPADAQRTDLWRAVGRGSRFLSEPLVGAETPPLLFLVLVTDGQDNVRSKPVQLGVPARVAVVHGALEIGDLAQLQPQSFESFDAAVRWIVSVTRSGETL